MRPFNYSRADNVETDGTRADDATFLIAGGTNLLDLMKLQVETPEELLDIGRLPLDRIAPAEGGGLRIGATVTNSDCAAHTRVRGDYPLLARAILAGASPQIRNRATTGGNLCQRTRCTYFTNLDMACNKREPGSGCGAIGGLARNHAILGTSEHCIATYPGDMAVALAALDAEVDIMTPKGDSRTVALRDFHLLPGDTPQRENVLERGEMILSVLLPPPVGGRQIYRKVRDRSSYAFALCSVACLIVMDGERIGSARLAFGGLAHKPWHDARVDALLTGEKPSDLLFERAADLLLADARPTRDNAFKIPLVRRVLKGVLREATGAKA